MQEKEQPVEQRTETDRRVSEQPLPDKVPIQSRQQRRIWSAIVLVVLCFIAAFGGNLAANRVGTTGGSVTNFSTAKNDGNLVVSQDEQDLSSLVQKVSPSVVSIVTQVTSRYGQVGQAAGTGMVISKDGYIITNKHVVKGAASATVIMSNGKTYKDVSIVGTDPLNDVAFLRIRNVKDLTPVVIGDSKTVRVGQSVVAIGNALGQYQNTVTTGIISGLGRPVLAAASDSDNESNTESLSDLLQTDAAINQGNSGGPLLNMSGQVIGMNTAIAADAQSIGFAIPIGATKGQIERLIKTGQVARAYIGVQYVAITPEVKAQYDLPVDAGDYVVSQSGAAVQSGSPAAKAGIQDRDILLKVNDQTIGPGRSVSTLIGEFQPGDTVQLTVLRDGKELTKKVILGQYK